MQFIDLQAQYRALKDEIDPAMLHVMQNATFIMGTQVAELEAQIGEYLGVKHVVSCANGTDALQMLFMAYDIGMGDAVFCPDVTFIASVEPACMLGATPVFCDVTPDTFNLCPESLERQIKAVLAEGLYAPRAVVAVDFLGNPAEYTAISAIAKKYGLLLIEDAAQSFGGEYQGKKCGSFGNAAATSFFPAKPLGCYGDGGAVMTNDDTIAERCRSIRVHGKGSSKYDNIRIGMNSRLDTLQAVVLQVKLRALQSYEMERRQEIAARYDDALKERFQLLSVGTGNRSTYAQYAFLAKDTNERDALIAHLNIRGIPTMVYYPTPQHQLKVFSKLNVYEEAFPNATHYCQHTLSIPMHPYLQEEEQKFIIEEILINN